MYITEKFLNKLFRLGALLVLILVLLDLLTFFMYPNYSISGVFLATREQTPLTWVSVVVLLLIGLSAASKYLETQSKLWYSVAAIFLFLSMDDAIYFHERFSAAVQELIPLLERFPSYSWVVIYFPVLIYGIGALTYLLKKHLSKKEFNFVVYALIILFVSVVLDFVDGWVGKNEVLVFCYDPSCSRAVEHLFRLTEEVLEIIGLGVFTYFSTRVASFKEKIDA